MSLKKKKVCKKYESDIWGDIARRGKINNFLENYFKNFIKRSKKRKFFTLSLVKEEKRFTKSKNLYKKLLFMKRCLLLFYRNERSNRFIGKLKKLDKFFYVNKSELLFHHYESRLDVVLYRMNFSLNIYDSGDLIRKGYVLVNKVVILNYSYTVKSGDIIEIVEDKKEHVYNRLKQRVSFKNYIFNFTSNLEIFYDILVGVYMGKSTSLSYLFSVEKNFFMKIKTSRL